ADLALTFIAKDIAAQCDQYIRRRVTKPLPHEVSGGLARAVVVDPDVAAAGTGGYIAGVGDHRHPTRDQAVDRLSHLGFVLRLQTDAVAAPDRTEPLRHL